MSVVCFSMFKLCVRIYVGIHLRLKGIVIFTFSQALCSFLLCFYAHILLWWPSKYKENRAGQEKHTYLPTGKCSHFFFFIKRRGKRHFRKIKKFQKKCLIIFFWKFLNFFPKSYDCTRRGLSDFVGALCVSYIISFISLSACRYLYTVP